MSGKSGMHVEQGDCPKRVPHLCKELESRTTRLRPNVEFLIITFGDVRRTKKKSTVTYTYTQTEQTWVFVVVKVKQGIP